MANVVLELVNLNWINGAGEDPADLCAHANVVFRIDQESLIRPEDGVWTVSAAALYLLRTLSRSHTKADPIAEHLFPCCGHAMYEVEGSDDVLLIGCNSGVDFEVVHGAGAVLVTSTDGRTCAVPVEEWRTAVCRFADAVHEFYERSAPKVVHDEHDARAFRKFWQEWSRRRSHSCTGT